jgi:arsenate reductase
MRGSGDLRVRLATPADAATIAEIHNQGIEDRIATFETALRSARDVEAQLAEKGERFPTVVVERAGHVVAWAGAGPYRSRAAYAGVAEHSVYVARGARGIGAGRVALEGLARECEARGFWKLVSRIFPENAASLALHERAGFRTVGIYRRHGRLEGRWRDCVIVERLLGEAAAALDDAEASAATTGGVPGEVAGPAALPSRAAPGPAGATARLRRVLFLCTGNSARSIMAECALNRWGAGRFRAFSAGSHPRGEVHPVAIALLRELGYPTEALRSKSWDEFARPDSPPFDFVFTVCDQAAGEACPLWPGQPVTAHWGVEDPAAFTGPPDAERRLFERVYRALEHRIRCFVGLRLDDLDAPTLRRRLEEIGLHPTGGDAPQST